MKNRKNNIFLLSLLLLLSGILTLQTANAANNPVPANYKEYTQLEIGDILFDTPESTETKVTQFQNFFLGAKY